VYKIVFFVPHAHAEAVKAALFAAGAGRFRDYDNASWETAGTGQFRPLSGATPFIGSEGSVERVAELRVEMICTEEHVRPALDALLAAHPYEEPAYELSRIWTREDLPPGV